MAGHTRPGRLDPDCGIIKPTAGAKKKEDWIGNQLKKVYDEALCEDIPPDMLELLSALDDSDADKTASDEEAAE
ncbi:NepR family anti-sigma factor [Stappia stellulata]|uniref:NepR family anti-sigma factor n=1 Tax=Stappia stellulata TaxID=71235 RepID=UPI00048EF0A2|nr:NepR family anti-sigma factor [Stappia stellulata]